MADNELDLMQWQVGTQSVFGTGVTATAKLMGISGGSIQPVIEASELNEARGALTPGYTVTLDKATGTASLEGDLTYEDVCYWLDSGFGNATPTGAGPYVRAYAGAGAKPTPRILTLFHGASGVATQKLIGGVVSKFGYAFESNKRGTFKTELLGHSVADGALAALSDRAVNPIHANDITLYIDTWAGTMGSTSIAIAKYNISADFDLNRMVQMSAGSLNPLGWKQKKAEAKSNTMTLALEVDSVSKAYLDSILTATSAGGPLKLQVRLKATIGANQIFQHDFAGFCAEAPELVTDTDGVAQYEFTLQALYHSTLASWTKFSVTNQVATLA